MQKIIKDRQLIDDQWVLLQESPDAATLELQTGRDIIVPLNCWQEQQELLATHEGQIGVWLDSHELPESLGEGLQRLPLIALNFPEFKDGRAFSSARALRQNLAYQGEIRAIGDVARDQLFFMARCGFTSFALREDQDPETCLEAFEDFREAYQPAIDQPLPLFRRRPA